MTADDEDLVEVVETIRDAMREFHAAMKFRDALTLKIGKRTTQIIRFSVIVMSLLIGAMFYLTYTLTANMSDISERMSNVVAYMEKINHHLISVANNMEVMKQSVMNMKVSMESMNNHISVMPVMNTAIIDMKADIFKMSRDMQKMNDSIALMEKSTDVMSVDIHNMNYQFTDLNNRFGVVGSNMNRMAAPMRMFFPFSQ